MANRRPVVYIAGPFRGAHDYERKLNRDRAEALAFLVWSAGAIALCPHMNTAHFDGALHDDIWLEGDLELLRRSDAIALTTDWQRSSGATAEYEEALNRHMPVFKVIDNTFVHWVISWMELHP